MCTGRSLHYPAPLGVLRADHRSLRFHEVLADRLRADPSLMDRVVARLDREEKRKPHWSHAVWREVLARPFPEILAFLTDPNDERAAQMRSCSSLFAGILTPKERNQVIRETR